VEEDGVGAADDVGGAKHDPRIRRFQKSGQDVQGVVL
jgi:hypothetical protein